MFNMLSTIADFAVRAASFASLCFTIIGVVSFLFRSKSDDSSLMEWWLMTITLTLIAIFFLLIIKL